MHNLPYVIQTGNYNISAISLRNISMEQIRDLMAKLSSQHQQEVLDFAQYLAEKKSKTKRKKLRFDWAGGLAEFNKSYTSLELQKKSLDWWSD